MDINCPRCGEPWDHDCLHEAAAEFDTTYDKIKTAFRTIGCSAIEYGPDAGPTCEVVNNNTTAAMFAAMELSDHADDWASDMDTFEALGLLD